MVTYRKRRDDFVRRALADKEQTAEPEDQLKHLVAVRPWWKSGYALTGGIVLLLVGLGLVPGVRAWLGDQWQALLSAGPEGRAADTLRPREATTRFGTATVTFPTTSPHFAVSVAETQAVGDLVIEVGAGATGTAEVLSGRNENLVVLSGELQIANTQTSTADYRVALPPRVETVTVRVAGGPGRAYSIVGRHLPVRWEIDLERPRDR